MLLLAVGTPGLSLGSSILPIAYYPLNGDAVDERGGFHGQVLGATAAVDRFGSPNGSLRFNGTSDHVLLGNVPAFNFAGSFSLSAWVKLDGVQSAKYIVAKYSFDESRGGVQPLSYGLGTEYNTARVYGFISGNAGEGFAASSGGPNLADGKWHALALVYERGNAVRTYVDGVLAASSPVGLLPPLTNSFPLMIGSMTEGKQAFGGWIDDVRLYGAVLSGSQIQSAFAADSNNELRITSEPRDALIDIGTNAVFEVSVAGSGAGEVHYQWFEDGIALAGATNRTHAAAVQLAAGTKSYTVTIHAGTKVLVSRTAMLVVSAPGTAGLLAHWTFDEQFEGSVQDATGRFPGQLTNGVRIAGRIGDGALQFNGTGSHLYIGGIGTPLQLTNTPYTIAWWQKWDGSSTWHQNVYAMDDGADYTGGYSAYVFQESSNLGIVHADGTASGWFNLAQLSPLSPVWRHFAVVYENGSQAFYEDGVLRGTRSGLRGLQSDGNDPLVLGGIRLNSGVFTNSFRGALDDFRIYNRALGPSELVKLRGLAPEIVIERHPSSVRAPSGQTVQLMVQAVVRGSSEAIRYQWERDGVLLANATNATLLATVPPTGLTQVFRVRLQLGDLSTYSDFAEVEAVSPQEARLLLHLDFEPKAGGPYADVYGNPVAAVGSVPLLPGRVGLFAGQFTGEGYLRVKAAGEALELVGTAYTIAWWMNPTEVRTFRSEQIFTVGVPKSTATGLARATGYGAFMDYPPFSAILNMYSEHRTDSGNVSQLALSAKSPTNWFHVAIIYDGIDRTISISPSGNPQASSASRLTEEAVLGSGVHDLLIGAEGVDSATIVGLIDDFRIYSYALASDEIDALRNVPIPATQLLISRQGNELLLRWSENSGQRYRVEFTAELGVGTVWAPTSGLVQRGEFLNTLVQPLDSRPRFYRLRSL